LLLKGQDVIESTKEGRKGREGTKRLSTGSRVAGGSL